MGLSIYAKIACDRIIQRRQVQRSAMRDIFMIRRASARVRV